MCGTHRGFFGVPVAPTRMPRYRDRSMRAQYRTSLLPALIACALALAVVACDRTAELIPGDSTPTDEQSGGAAETAATALVPPAALRVRGEADETEEFASISDIELARSVVQIWVIDDRSGTPVIVRNGSGIVVDEEAGLILTAAHIVDPFRADGGLSYTSIAIATNRAPGAGPIPEFMAELVALDRTSTLAVVRVTGPYVRASSGATDNGTDDDPLILGLRAATVGDSTALRRGDSLRLFGHPGLNDGAAYGEAPDEPVQLIAVTDVAIDGFQGDPAIPGRTWIKTGARLPFGSAGGPAFNKAGELVGIVSQRRYDAAVPAARVRPISLAESVLMRARAAAGARPAAAPLVRTAAVPGTAFQAAPGSAFVDRPNFAANIMEDGNAQDLFDYEVSFAPALPELFYEFAAQGIPEGAQVQEIWYLDSVVQDELSSSYSWALGSFAIVTDRLATPNPRGNPSGVWRLEVWVDGELRSAGVAYLGVEPPERSVDNFQFASRVTAQGGPGGSPSGDASQILMFFDYQGAATVHEIRWVALRDGRAVYLSPAVPWRSGESGTWWVGYYDPDGVGAGEWTFEIYFDNQHVAEGATVVP